MSPTQGGGDEVEAEKRPNKVKSPRDKEEPLKKSKVSPLKPSSQKKSKASMTKMQTVLTSYDFDFLIVALNDASLEIAEK
jgi:hypothetical protein